ncbi:hypothetical protein AYL99_10146 [Fonsecaea erecta]|uniref:AB hydrolase-1 domain-containing protein n=1 Tax=Fonsecaea erecta TaxID=1367422 RepID=A0A178Z874_9EURO|nr:hypothetical protein AYL99_10146 [Fonsecaea erecta]OAP55994.1 hypothetical protein AYL99_10146 [Fonsecaea erecta]
MSKSKPTFVIVHGAWHRPAHFEPLMKALNQHGYRTVAPALPSVDKLPDEVVPDHQADIAIVREAILAELECEDGAAADVIVVPHSYGGLPSSGAIRGLEKPTREAAGHKTGVVGLAALTSFVLPAGMTLAAVEGREPPQLPDLFDPPPADLFFHDLPSDEAARWAAQLGPMSSRALLDASSFTAYTAPGVRVHYLLVEDDRAIKFPTQQAIVARMREDGADPRTESLPGCGHSPFLSRIEETVAFLRRSAGEDVP